MKRTKFIIKKMDCPSEIKLIEGIAERIDQEIKMEFDLNERSVTFYHRCEENEINESLKAASLPGEMINSVMINENEVPEIKESVEASTLKYLLGINFTMFVVEILVGFHAQSTGLIADGLDMLADSFVYGISLFVVGKTIVEKNKAARLSGYMQITLGVLCLAEVLRKFHFGSEPVSTYMIATSLVALAANLFCLALIHKHKDGEVHMKASWIFSANDVIVNTGVIISGVLVHFLGSNIPDLLIGAIVSMVVIRGGIIILKLSNSPIKENGKEQGCTNSKCSGG